MFYSPDWLPPSATKPTLLFTRFVLIFYPPKCWLNWLISQRHIKHTHTNTHTHTYFHKAYFLFFFSQNPPNTTRNAVWPLTEQFTLEAPQQKKTEPLQPAALFCFPSSLFPHPPPCVRVVYFSYVKIWICILMSTQCLDPRVLLPATAHRPSRAGFNPNKTRTAETLKCQTA